MPYSEDMYKKMDDYEYYGGEMMKGEKHHEGRFKYDIGYGEKHSGDKYNYNGAMGDPGMYKERGNNYSAIQDSIYEQNHRKLGAQMYDNYLPEGPKHNPGKRKNHKY